MHVYNSKLTTFVIALLITGCAQKPLTRWIELPSTLQETSGLACYRNKLFTLNDSGNAPTLYELSSDGAVGREYHVSAENHDWEAITATDTALFIGDVGDNNGTRSSLVIYQYVLDQPEEQRVKPWYVQYPEQLKDEIAPYQHDRDSEAIVALSDTLLILVTKSWLTNIAHVYSVQLQDTGKTHVTKVADISGLPGIVTDIAKVPNSDDFIVVGYANYRLNPFEFMFGGTYSPFIARLNAEYQVKNVRNLHDDGQVEAVSFCQGALWITAEGTRTTTPKLWRVDQELYK